MPPEKTAVAADYQADAAEGAGAVLDRLGALRYDELLDFERLAQAARLRADVDPLDHAVSPRGYRVLSHVPRLPDNVIRRVVSRLDGLEAIVRASQRELEAVEGVGPSARARSARACDDSRSTTSSTATCSSRREQRREQARSRRKLPIAAPICRENAWISRAFSLHFRYTRSNSPVRTWVPASWLTTVRGRAACTKSATRWCIPTTGQEPSSGRTFGRCSGRSGEYLTIQILHNDMTVNVPCDNCRARRPAEGDRRGHGREGREGAHGQRHGRCRRTGTGVSSTTATR